MILFGKSPLRFSLSPLGGLQQQIRRIFLLFSLEISIVRISLSLLETHTSLRKLHVRLLWMQISTPPPHLFVFLSYEILAKFGRCRFVLFLRVESVHQVLVIQRTLRLLLLSLKISKRLSKCFDKLLIFIWVALIVSDFFFYQKEIFQSHLGKDKNIRSSVY